MENYENDEILIQGNICKSISGQEDENGNYIFEVEASNENLDLQNQITLQSALLKSKEYFLTNGVISDDHLHKTRNPDGSVETHKDKIIGEPISIRTDGKSTFVKGILYAGVKAAKDYINLLKNNSTRVKASIGGIMPKIKKNADGSETVTSFMWNDLALTCSPVNWTVGSAKFAKSVSMVDFCKSLNAGLNENGLQKEDIEDETEEMIDITDGDLSGDDEKDDLKKSQVEIIKDVIKAIESGDVINKGEIEVYLQAKGFDRDNARETALEIIKQGGQKMIRGHFTEKIDDILKSMSEDEKDVEKKSDSKTLFDDADDMPDDDEKDEDDVEKCGVKKSIDEEDYADATELIMDMNKSIDDLKAENESLRKSLEETQEKMLEVTKSFGDYLSKPETRQTVVEKSIPAGGYSEPMKKPTQADFEIMKSVLIQNARDGKLRPDEVQFYSSSFQDAVNGKKVEKSVMAAMVQMVRDSRA